MHQPSTGHLRSTVCCAVSSVPAEKSYIDSPKIPPHTLTSFFPLFCFFFGGTLYVPLHISDISCTPPLFHLITPLSCFLFRSFICLSPVSLPLPTLLHTLHNSSSVLPQWFLPPCDLSLFLALEQGPTHNPSNANIEPSFNLCDSWHRRLVSYIKWYSGIKVMAIAWIICLSGLHNKTKVCFIIYVLGFQRNIILWNQLTIFVSKHT